MKKLLSILFVFTILLSTSQTYAQRRVVENAKAYYKFTLSKDVYDQLKTEKVTKTLKDSLEDKVDFLLYEMKYINDKILTVENTLLSNIDYEKYNYNLNLLSDIKNKLKINIKELKHTKILINKINQGKIKNIPIKYYIFIINDTTRTIVEYNCKTKMYSFI